MDPPLRGHSFYQHRESGVRKATGRGKVPPGKEPTRPARLYFHTRPSRREAELCTLPAAPSIPPVTRDPPCTGTRGNPALTAPGTAPAVPAPLPPPPPRSRPRVR